MYSKLYASFVSGYLRFYGLELAQRIAAWMLAALAVANSAAAIALAADHNIGWAETVFSAIKNKYIALAFGLAVLIGHIYMAPWLKRKIVHGGGPERWNLAQKWPGNLYTVATVLFCFYVSKTIR